MWYIRWLRFILLFYMAIPSYFKTNSMWEIAMLACERCMYFITMVSSFIETAGHATFIIDGFHLNFVVYVSAYHTRFHYYIFPTHDARRTTGGHTINQNKYTATLWQFTQDGKWHTALLVNSQSSGVRHWTIYSHGFVLDLSRGRFPSRIIRI